MMHPEFTHGARATTRLPLVSVVVIGRNEGERLVRCLSSVGQVTPGPYQLELIYVDSDSTDGSAERALALGARVIRVQPQRPSAALGRNAGWQAAQGEFVLFLDGDTVLHPDFLLSALPAMAAPEVAVVWGHRRESKPEQSWYVRVLDLDWVYPPGDTAFCGGDALMRRQVLEKINGFDDTLIAGEEPEMCQRILAQGGRIVHLDVPMTLHDLALTTWTAYWRRAFRAGHAYAEVSARFKGTEHPLWERDARRNLIHAAAMVLAGVGCLMAVILALKGHAPAGWGLAAVVAWSAGSVALLWRTVQRCAWKSPNVATRWLYAVHSHLQQLPIAWGQLVQKWNHLQGRRQRLIEYKGTAGRSVR